MITYNDSLRKSGKVQYMFCHSGLDPESRFHEEITDNEFFIPHKGIASDLLRVENPPQVFREFCAERKTPHNNGSKAGA